MSKTDLFGIVALRICRGERGFSGWFKRGKTVVIQIRQYRKGNLEREFSSQVYHWRNPAGINADGEIKQIESCYKLCIKAHESDSWIAAGA